MNAAQNNSVQKFDPVAPLAALLEDEGDVEEREAAEYEDVDNKSNVPTLAVSMDSTPTSGGYPVVKSDTMLLIMSPTIIRELEDSVKPMATVSEETKNEKTVHFQYNEVEIITGDPVATTTATAMATAMATSSTPEQVVRTGSGDMRTATNAIQS